MDEAKVWRQYQSAKTAANRNAVIDYYWKRISGRIANSLQKRKCGHLHQEVLSAVAERIIAAVPRCTGPLAKKRNCLLRNVDGAVLDALRTLDPKPRKSRAETNDIEEARIQLGHKLGRRPNDYDLAEYLGIDESVLVKAQQTEHERQTVTLESHHLYLVAIEDEARQAGMERFNAVIDHLSASHRKIAICHFAENMNRGQVARHLGMSPSSVTRAISEIRTFLRKNMDTFDDFCRYNR